MRSLDVSDIERIQGVLLEILGCTTYQQTFEQSQKILDILDTVPEENKIALLVYVLKHCNIAPQSKHIDHGEQISMQRYSELSWKLHDDTHEAFHVWIRQNPSEEEVAQKLLQYLNHFENRDEQVFVLTVILTDSHIPYRQIPDALDDVSDEEMDAYRILNTFEDLADAMSLVRSILSRSNELVNVPAMLAKFIFQEKDEARRIALVYHVIEAVRDDAEIKTRAVMGEKAEKFFAELISQKEK